MFTTTLGFGLDLKISPLPLKVFQGGHFEYRIEISGEAPSYSCKKTGGTGWVHAAVVEDEGKAYCVLSGIAHRAPAKGPYVNITVSDSADPVSKKAAKVTLEVHDALGISPPITLHDGRVSERYEPVTFTASGGVADKIWSYTGSLPQGMEFKQGMLKGKPKENGKYTITVAVHDKSDPNGRGAKKTLRLVVVDPVKIANLSGVAGAEYRRTKPAVSGGYPPYELTPGSGIPEYLNVAGGKIGGVPTVAGEFDAKLGVKDRKHSAAEETAVHLSILPFPVDIPPAVVRSMHSVSGAVRKNAADRSANRSFLAAKMRLLAALLQADLQPLLPTCLDLTAEQKGNINKAKDSLTDFRSSIAPLLDDSDRLVADAAEALVAAIERRIKVLDSVGKGECAGHWRGECVRAGVRVTIGFDGKKDGSTKPGGWDSLKNTENWIVDDPNLEIFDPFYPVDSSSDGSAGPAMITDAAFRYSTQLERRVFRGTLAIGSDNPLKLKCELSQAKLPPLSVTSAHAGSFTQGQEATYTLTVTNTGLTQMSGAVTVTDTLPEGLELKSMSWTGWPCDIRTTRDGLWVGTCTRIDPLAPGSSYEPITVKVSVADNAPRLLVNAVSVISAGAAAASGSDVTMIVPPMPPPLSVRSAHGGNFTQGQEATYTVTVTNTGLARMSGAVTVTDTLPPGLTLLSMSGTGWPCDIRTTIEGLWVGTCTRSDPLAVGLSYAPITVTVSVANNAPQLLVNAVSVNSAGAATASGSDVTMVVPPAPVSNVSEGLQNK